ncbi:MAG: formylglycine-generating enzyme family protein [Bdellovibrionaceae bacterium]|nr:formylglycine-generating enzyme family protein [Pseudobdellovibrionaceae bacterium]
MKHLFGLLSLLINCAPGQASEMTLVPSGKVEAIWLSPMSKKTPTKPTKIEVKVEAFKAQTKPVTVAEFKKFLEQYPQWSKEKISSIYADSSYLTDFSKRENSDDQRPVTYVTWFVARAYCESMALRLPTVNEWEYMAAASETKKDANRNPQFLKRILEWYGEPQEGRLKSVGSIYKNMYGIWDLHGLIWEWVEDFNSTFVTGESREDSSFNKDMFCGAGALSSADKENYAAFMRFAFRSSLKGRSSVWNLGFRCVK